MTKGYTAIELVIFKAAANVIQDIIDACNEIIEREQDTSENSPDPMYAKHSLGQIAAAQEVLGRINVKYPTPEPPPAVDPEDARVAEFFKGPRS